MADKFLSKKEGQPSGYFYENAILAAALRELKDSCLAGNQGRF
jgi:hypothetical protein